MSFEMSCANCTGRLMVETLGIVVACPHCGTHLAIPAEIPGLTDAPAKSPAPETPKTPPKIEFPDLITEEGDADADDETEGEAGPPGNKTTWFPDDGEEKDENPSSFPDFSKLNEQGAAAASESNVIVSEPEQQTETDVPSAVRVVNPDPSEVMPAIITDATVSEPVSGFPELNEPAAAVHKPSELETSTPAEPQTTLPASVVEAVPTPTEAQPHVEATGPENLIPKVAEPTEPASSFPALNESPNAEPVDAEPIVQETVEMVNPFLAMNGGQLGAEDSGTLPMIVTDKVEPPQKAPAASTSSATANAPVAAAPQATAVPSAAPAPSAKTAAQPTKKESVYDSVFSSRRGKLIPNPVFQAWVSYTILITGGLAMAIYYAFSAPTSNLESLPDIVPPPKTKAGNIVGFLIPEEANMPPGHTLELNSTQRFGNIEVTPVRVTQGELVLEGQSYVDASRRTIKDGKVVKLWLKFKNVSKDQNIAPLDNELLFFRKYGSGTAGKVGANNFVCNAKDKNSQGNVILIYDHAVDGDYDLKGQDLGKALKPGEEAMIYIPSERDGPGKLKGDLIWRVHFRKGYSPKNYGVTTVLEVKFHSDAIQAESSNA